MAKSKDKETKGLGLQIGLPEIKFDDETTQQLQQGAQNAGIGQGGFGMNTNDPFGVFPNNGGLLDQNITPTPTPSLGPSLEVKDGELVEGDLSTDSNIKLPEGTTGGDNSPHGGDLVLGDGTSHGTEGNLTNTPSNNNTTPSTPSSNSTPTYTPPTNNNNTTPSTPSTNDTSKEDAAKAEADRKGKETTEQAVERLIGWVPVKKDEVVNKFTYQDRKKYDLDKTSTEVFYDKNNGQYIVRDKVGNIYKVSGEGEGSSFEKTADELDWNGDGNVSFGEWLVKAPARAYYKAQDVADSTYDLFSDPSEELKEWKREFEKKWGELGEDWNMAWGDVDKFGRTKVGSVGDRDGDGQITFQDRFSNTVDNMLTSVNDRDVNRMADMMYGTLLATGMDSKQAKEISDGAKTTLSVINGAIHMAWNPITGVIHMASAAADVAHDPKAQANIKKQQRLEEDLYGTTATVDPTPVPNGADDIEAPDSVEAYYEKLTKEKIEDADEKAMRAIRRNVAENEGNYSIGKKQDSLAAMKHQAEIDKYEEDELKRRMEEEAKKAADELEKGEEAIKAEKNGDNEVYAPGLQGYFEKKYGKNAKWMKPFGVSDEMLKTYVLRDMAAERGNANNDPLKRLIQLKIIQ